ncbi:MAG: PEGA domain-containing protein, partial [Myxococcota bacterium]
EQRIHIVSSALEPDLEAVAARVGSAARAALRQVDGAAWQDADQRYLGYVPEMVERLASARTALAEGTAAYLELDLATAIDRLSTAIGLFDEAQAALEDESDLGQALLYLGASQEFDGRSRQARTTFERLHRQMPHIVPDPAEFPPAVVDAYNAAAPRRSPGVMHIESDPTGAIAYVDFVPRGLTGLTIEGLVRGEHTVRLTRPGATPYVEQVTVGRRQQEVAAFLVDAEGNEGLAEVVQSIAGHELRVGDGAIADLAERLELEKIGVIRVSYGDTSDDVRLELVIFDVASQRRVLRGEVVAPRALGELEPVVQRSVRAAVETVISARPDGESIAAADDENIIGVESVGDDTAEPTREPLYKKWWLWTAVGVVAVAGIVTAIAVTRDGSNLGQAPDGEVVLEF